jgi:sulfite dehydrogenase (cytochrome) subunit A
MPRQSALRAPVFTRRRFLKNTALSLGTLVAGGAASAFAADKVTMPFANGERTLVKFPQKRPLIVLTMRPPQLETPFSVFNEGILTPNDAFFVRYHLSQVPTSIDLNNFALEIKGSVNSPLKLSLTDLKNHFEPIEIVAVNQCSGNSRGFFKPRVAGGQMGNGAMGNARWRGVRLKDLLSKAGVAAGAKQVAFNGLDSPVVEKIPDFIKSIEIDHALDADTLLAYQMNGEDLPMLNGFPLRLVLPGHFGTYWVKHLNEITVLDEQFKGYWMDPAYRIPDTAGACVEPGTTPKHTKPIMRFNVRSFITSLAERDKVERDRELTIRGIAFDGGSGISEVLFSEDGGKQWRQARLGENLGKYSFREWTIPFTARKAGSYDLQVKAINRIGESQPAEALWNPAGYMRNVVETIRVSAT